MRFRLIIEIKKRFRLIIKRFRAIILLIQKKMFDLYLTFFRNMYLKMPQITS